MRGHPLRLALAVLAVVAVVLGGGGLVLSVTRGEPTGAAAATGPSAAAGRTAQATTPAGPAVRLAVAGDVGTGDEEEYATAAAMDEREGDRPYDALVLLGDNIYESGDPALADQAVLDPFEAVLDDRTELVAALGNHDVRDGNGAAVLDALGQPAAWRQVSEGPVDLFVLDSNRPDDPEQTAWLEEALRGSTAPWQVAAMHHPPYSAGFHGSAQDVQDAWVPLFEKYGVDLVLSGHDHDYQRSEPINGITYVVSGAAAKLRPTGTAPFTAVSTSTRHFLDVEATADRLTMVAVGQDGEALDGLTLTAGG